MPVATLTEKQIQRQSRVVWFEIPVADLDRASRFYSHVFQTAMRHAQMGSETMAVFPYEAPAISGCLILVPGHKPADNGATVYLNADPSLDAALARVWEAGGRIATPQTALPGDMGVYAVIIDSEGNRVGLHAME